MGLFSVSDMCRLCVCHAYGKISGGYLMSITGVPDFAG
ncbi:hypothetical protein thalar_01793 [Litoreibacter arenae DSM 19593]|uniref:Uncharacterized protein n=1 Tax=Litoreibacter arenae DSM 19593 TaxID=1123360 RepID=S9QGJ0_9RHOB|nr:hypothetical protein thalar_01793 [Litoreibacter arenae DSM 19593]